MSSANTLERLESRIIGLVILFLNVAVSLPGPIVVINQEKTERSDQPDWHRQELDEERTSPITKKQIDNKG